MKSIITLSAITILAALALVGCNQNPASGSGDASATNSSASSGTNSMPDMGTNMPAKTNQ